MTPSRNNNSKCAAILLGLAVVLFADVWRILPMTMTTNNYYNNYYNYGYRVETQGVVVVEPPNNNDKDNDNVRIQQQQQQHQQQPSTDTQTTSASVAVDTPQTATKGLSDTTTTATTTTTMLRDKDDTQQQQQQQAPCSCWNLYASAACCHRALMPTHKMGFDVALQLRRALIKFYQFPHPKAIQSNQIERPKMNKWMTTGTPGTSTSTSNTRIAQDRRYVVFIRNIYSAIASGYLYHRAGHECHVEPRGNGPWQWNKIPNLHYFWEYLSPELVLPAPHDNRSLCVYLANETMYNGLYVYMDWVFTEFYNHIPIFLEWSQQQQQQQEQYNNNSSSSTFTITTATVCFDDLTSRHGQAAAMQIILQTFFPSSYNNNNNLTVQQQQQHKERYTGWTPGQQVYTGGHATSHDPVLRQEIKNVTQQLDRTVFGGMVKAFQQRYTCGGGE